MNGLEQQLRMMVHIKGTDELQEKLPSYSGKRIIILLLLVILVVLLDITFLVMMYVLPSLQPNNQFLIFIEPFLPILGQTVSIALGFIFVSRVWSKRERLLSESRETAYQKGIISAIIGIPMVMVTVIHRLVPIELFWNPQNPLTKTVATPLFSENKQLSLIAFGFGAIIVLTGFLTAIRTLEVFGIDYMALVYLYFPDESELKANEIYSIVRHPAYFALMLMALGEWIAYLTLYAFTSFIIFVIGINLHLKFVEEKELLKRFGPDYIEYKKKVPIVIKLQKLPILFRYILFG
ncbi:MAG: methyltransferase family protein [Candidatus Hodarchaeales archaeon]